LRALPGSGFAHAAGFAAARRCLRFLVIKRVDNVVLVCDSEYYCPSFMLVFLSVKFGGQ